MKAKNHKALEIWIKTLQGLIDDDQGFFVALVKDLQRIADEESGSEPQGPQPKDPAEGKIELKEAHYNNVPRSECRPADGESWEQFCERKSKEDQESRPESE